LGEEKAVSPPELPTRRVLKRTAGLLCLLPGEDLSLGLRFSATSCVMVVKVSDNLDAVLATRKKRIGNVIPSRLAELCCATRWGIGDGIRFRGSKRLINLLLSPHTFVLYRVEKRIECE
jgi:hypothetical protein